MAHDYLKLGFKAGLEIHQQLDTPKLFSGAPSFLRTDAPHYTLQRKLHAVAGEMGEVDVAAAHESAQGKTFYYEGYHDTISLVELDEEPPRPINEQALDVALQVALLLNCEMYPVTQVMRKTVIDGSNTGGFQRTVLIAHDGFIETSFGKVPVDTVCLEEDSARIISKESGKTVFRLDRIGIPLVEIATAPAMVNPEQVKEAALHLGDILRVCTVKRGIGTIRQDVNVSIKGHERVEIKGFQDPAMMIATIDKEIERQLGDIKQKKVVGAVRNALPDGTTEFMRPMPGKARMYPETDVPLLKIGLERINRLKKNLPKLKSDIRAELKKRGLNDEMIALVLSDSSYVDSFLMLIRVYSKDANLVAKMIALWRQEIATKERKSLGEITKLLHERVLESILEKVDAGSLDVRDVRTVMFRIAQGVSFKSAVVIEKVDDNALEAEVRAIIKEKPGLRANAYMGLVMAKLKGTIDAKKAMELITRILGS
ncbi:MAG: Glu-tRNA(Gln) amidotransferase subunit GatE [Nanoarchaeota archaeon]